MTGILLAVLLAATPPNSAKPVEPVHAAALPVKHDAFFNYEQYLSGTMFLSSSNTMKPEEKAAWYERLVKLTGVTAADFIKFRHKYDDDPAGWEHVLNEAQKIPAGH